MITIEGLLRESERRLSAHPDVASAEVSAFATVRILEVTPKAPPTMLVEGLVADGEFTLWNGHGGSGKSTLMLHVAVCVAVDRLVFGTLRVHRPGPVVIFAPEDGEGGVRMILDAIIAGMGLTSEERALAAARLFVKSDEDVVDITRHAQRIGQTANDHAAVLVIGDPARNMLGGADENDAKVATQAIVAMRQCVCRDAGAAFLLLHHLRKPGKDADQRTATTQHDSAGSAAWSNSARLVFAVSKKSNRITLRATKANRVAADLTHEIDLGIVADITNAATWVSCTLTDANDTVVVGTQMGLSDTLTLSRGRPLNTNERLVLDAIYDVSEPDRRFSHHVWQKAGSDAGLSVTTFKSIKTRLLVSGLAAKVATGKKTRNGSTEFVYLATDTGVVALQQGGGP